MVQQFRYIIYSEDFTIPSSFTAEVMLSILGSFKQRDCDIDLTALREKLGGTFETNTQLVEFLKSPGVNPILQRGGQQPSWRYAVATLLDFNETQWALTTAQTLRLQPYVEEEPEMSH
ncbi:hypothetical protein DL770_010362 [Monosporascus sp. CRB-9-2]|nr:hypothetical protein DL770_010362 [Monosporascus sp. CRB-9-2]